MQNMKNMQETTSTSTVIEDRRWQVIYNLLKGASIINLPQSFLTSFNPLTKRQSDGKNFLEVAKEEQNEDAIEKINVITQIMHDNENQRNKLLLRACEEGKVELVADLLSKGANFNCTDEFGRTPLWFSATSSLPITKLLINAGAEINITPHEQDYSHSPLSAAALYSNNFAIFSFLLAQGADPTLTGEHQETPLHYAAYVGNLKIVKLLLENEKAKLAINHQSSKGSTPLHLAAEKQHDAIIICLLEAGATPNVVDCLNNTPLFYYIALLASKWRPRIEKTVNTFLNKGANINSVNGEGYTALGKVILRQNSPFVKFLLFVCKADPNLPTLVSEVPMAITPLGIAIQLKNSQLVGMLLNANANPNQLVMPDSITFEKDEQREKEKEKEKEEEAESRNNIGTSLLLLSRVPAQEKLEDINDTAGYPIHFACQMGSLEIVKLLFETRRLNINIRASKGETGLFIAAQHGYHQIVEFLLRNGADPKLDRDNKVAPLYFIYSSKTVQIPNIDNPMTIAYKYGHGPVIRILFDHYKKDERYEPEDIDKAYKILYPAPKSAQEIPLSLEPANERNSVAFFSSSKGTQGSHRFLQEMGFAKEQIKEMKRQNRERERSKEALEQVLCAEKKENASVVAIWLNGKIVSGKHDIHPVESTATETDHYHVYLDRSSLLKQGASSELLSRAKFHFCAAKGEQGLKKLKNPPNIVIVMDGQNYNLRTTYELKFKNTPERLLMAGLRGVDRRQQLLISVAYLKDGLHKKAWRPEKTYTINLPPLKEYDVSAAEGATVNLNNTMRF